MKTLSRIYSWVLLALCGLTSAILCIAPPSVSGGGSLALFYVGVVYGVLLAVYFATCGAVRSIPRLLSVVVVSAVAWPVAYLGSFAAAGFIPGGTVPLDMGATPAFPLIVFGGVLGGFVLLIPALLLLRRPSSSRGGALVKAFLGTLLSAIVGGIAWQLGPSLGAAIWSLLPTTPIPQPESYGMSALFFVWQPVMALFIGWATSEGRKPVLMNARRTPSKLGTLAPQPNDGFSRRAFELILLGLVAVSLTRIIPVRIRVAHRERVAENKRQSKPSSVDLPVAEPMNEENALILKDIGNYQPDHALKRVEPVSHEKGFESPLDFDFSTLYTKTGEPVPQWPLAPKQYISVVVQQYPNSAWAQYFAEYPPRRYISPDDPKKHAVITQFDNEVRSNQIDRSPGQTWNPLYYTWPSGDSVITVEYKTSDENLEIVRAYLEKYPSSIR